MKSDDHFLWYLRLQDLFRRIAMPWKDRAGRILWKYLSGYEHAQNHQLSSQADKQGNRAFEHPARQDILER